MPSGPDLREIGIDQFTAQLDVFIDIYAAAMGAPPPHLPGRRSIMARHTGYPAFRAITATAAPISPVGSTRAPAGTVASPSDTPGGLAGARPSEPGTPPTGPGTGGNPAPVIAFAYGFHGERGQWWHDLVHGALAAAHDPAEADRWMADSFEIAEVHVRPDHQGHGIGRRLMLWLTDGRPEQTAVLSTPDADTRARRLYQRLGFSDLLTAFSFPGGSPP
ncbi:MAG TPA: GNAT family N-acetyltransferase, partial [Streptosporangiaceae bacterium]|nr:GNAT family N-acetyltransferase [Streptosporangiaceae bacterium]